MKIIALCFAFTLVLSVHYFNQGHYLLSLDKNLIEIFENPINSSKTADLFLYMEDYYNTLCDLKKKMNRTLIGISESVDVFINDENPRFFKMKINFNKIQKVLKLNNSEIEELKRTRSNIEKTWRTVESEVETFRSEIKQRLDLNESSESMGISIHSLEI
uniref:Prolyl 4-hydroxylase alpha-subunit N-terminal domain-containing protein n=1 Tax=Clastoptera arizonana TaxID=38151 RepID=A0A1B6E9P0_9HEMI